jgi:hypothetical protein
MGARRKKGKSKKAKVKKADGGTTEESEKEKVKS